MAPRRNYNKIPVIDKTRLRESFNRGEDFLQLAKILGIVKKVIEYQAVVIDTAKYKAWHNNAMTFIPRCIVEAEIL